MKNDELSTDLRSMHKRYNFFVEATYFLRGSYGIYKHIPIRHIYNLVLPIYILFASLCVCAELYIYIGFHFVTVNNAVSYI